MKIGVIFSRGSIEHSRTRSATHQPVERFFTPFPERFLNAVRAVRRGREGVVEEILQIPPHLMHQIAA